MKADLGPKQSKAECSTKLLCATFGLFLPAVCLAQCKAPVTTLKVRIEASDSDKALLLEMLKRNGCDGKIGFEATDVGFHYRIVLANGEEGRPYVYYGGSGTTRVPVVLTTVYDGWIVLFSFTRGNRITHRGEVNASAKEIVKRLIRLRSSK
jgi:hypothetical protein